MSRFKNWLLEAHPEIFEEGIADWMRANRKWIAPAVVAAGSYFPHSKEQQSSHLNQPYVGTQAAASFEDGLINYIQNRYGVAINKNQIQMMRPKDLIAPMYGNQWNNVYQRAQNARYVDLDGLDEKLPAAPNGAAMDLAKLNDVIPVIHANPRMFGQEDGTQGFCATGVINGKTQKFCVIENPKAIEIIRHELSHSTQDNLLGRTLGNAKATDRFNKYLMREEELGVRLAEMKRNYYQLTGNIATSEKQSFMGMISHFLHNPRLYSQDVQQLKSTIDQAKKAGKLSELIHFLRDNVDRVVSKDSTTNKMV